MRPPTLEDNWRTRYERWASQHELDHEVAGWSAQGLTRRVDLVLHAIQQTSLTRGSRLLDLGSGPGTYTRILAHQGFECVGIDYSRNVIRLAKAKDSTGLYLQGEAYHLPFRDRSFDALLCVGVLQSLTSAVDAMVEMRRVLKPRGYLFVDGLNSLFWLHLFRAFRQKVTRAEKRMSYYSPFHLAKLMQTMGLLPLRIDWLTAPAAIESWIGSDGTRTQGGSFFFGYAFLISARNSKSPL